MTSDAAAVRHCMRRPANAQVRKEDTHVLCRVEKKQVRPAASGILPLAARDLTDRPVLSEKRHFEHHRGLPPRAKHHRQRHPSTCGTSRFLGWTKVTWCVYTFSVAVVSLSWTICNRALLRFCGSRFRRGSCSSCLSSFYTAPRRTTKSSFLDYSTLL